MWKRYWNVTGRVSQAFGDEMEFLEDVASVLVVVKDGLKLATVILVGAVTGFNPAIMAGVDAALEAGDDASNQIQLEGGLANYSPAQTLSKAAFTFVTSYAFTRVTGPASGSPVKYWIKRNVTDRAVKKWGANWLTKTVTPFIANIVIQESWGLPKAAVKVAVIEMAVQLEETGSVNPATIYKKIKHLVKKRCTLKYWTETVFKSLVSSVTHAHPEVAEAVEKAEAKSGR